MGKFIGIVAAVACCLLISNVAGIKLKFKEQDGYVYKQEQKSPFEVDVTLTVDGQSKGITAIYVNETHVKPFVVHIPADPTYCHIIFPDTAISKEDRETCSETKRLENFDRFPDEVETKCEGRTALLIKERSCKGEGAKKDKRIFKRSCYYGSAVYQYFSSTSRTLNVEYSGTYNEYSLYLYEYIDFFETYTNYYEDCYV